METFPVSDSFRSSLLSDHCGFEVKVNFNGTVRRPLGTQQLEIANIDWFATANNKSVRFRNVSVAHIQAEPDGTVTLSIQGHKPEFTGRMKINLATGEVVEEPQQTGNLDRICELLSA
jgi:hypothetical protein